MADDPRAGELTTTNYHWTKPTVGQSDDAWGGYLNADLDSIDSIVHGIDTRVIPPGGAIVSDTPPASPTPGMLWFDSVGGQTYVWYSDPNTSQWVLAVSGTQGPQGATGSQGPAGPNTLPMGVIDGSNAAAGQIGEVISFFTTSPGVTLTSGTAATVTSIPLTPGDWDVQGEVWVSIGAGGATQILGSISPVGAVLGGGTQAQARSGFAAAFSASNTPVFPLTPSSRDPQYVGNLLSNGVGVFPVWHDDGFRQHLGEAGAMIDFPASPTVGQTFTAAGVTWTYDGAKWTLGPSTPNLITVSDTPPPNPSQGALWWESVNGQMYVFYNDGSSSQWVPTTNQMGGGYATTAYVDAARLGDNRIINGDMRIDQRNNGAAGTASGYTIDRWQYISNQASKFNWGRAPSGVSFGFPYYLSCTSAGAYTALAADGFRVEQVIEADMVSDFAWGTPNAQPVTLSFLINSTLTGTFSGAIANAPNPATRSYPFTFNIPVINTWTKIAVTIPGDIAGTWVMSGNAASVFLRFDLGSGANFRGPPNAWASGNYIGATGAVSVVSTNAAGFYLTGVKLEIGSIATPYNRQSLAKSMADCQRYYQTAIFSIGGYSPATAVTVSSAVTLSTWMRATPTVTPNETANTGMGTRSFNIDAPNSVRPSGISGANGGFLWQGSLIASAEL